MKQTSAGSRSTKAQREPFWDAKIPWFQIADDDTVYVYRLVARAYFYANHWIQTKKKDGTLGKSFPYICQNFDPVNNTYAENGCEICAFMDQVNQAVNQAKEKWENLPTFVKKAGRRKTMAHNVIVRQLQEQGPPANNTGSWSFIVPMRFPQGFANTLSELQEKFNKKAGQVYALSHGTEGRDLQISYNSQAKDPGSMYQVQLGDRTPISEEERAHSKHLIDFGSFMKYPKQSDVKTSLVRNGYYEWLDNFVANLNLKTITKSEPAAQQQAAAQTPASAQQPPAQQAAHPDAPPPGASAMDGDTGAIVADHSETAPAQQVAAPAQTQAAAPPTQPAPAQAPVQQAAAAPSDIAGKLQAFSQATGIGLQVIGKEFADVRLYQPNMAVPVCFTQYSATDKKICKQCPLKLDCMMTDAG